jgi:histidinol-phosphate phosphatase family protein
MSNARVAAHGRRAVFLDTDGTLIESGANNAEPGSIRFMPNALEGLRLLAHGGLPLFIVTNQPALATGRLTRLEYVRLQQAFQRMLEQQAGVSLAGWYTCPHAADSGCLCRKPASGLLRQAALAHQIDLASSWMVGDILDDIEAGRRVGCTTVLVDVGNETVWRKSPLREPHHRCTDFLAAAELIIETYERTL